MRLVGDDLHEWDIVVMDAEPMIAYARDERGSERVEPFLSAIENEDLLGYIHPVNLSEIYWVVGRNAGHSDARTYVDKIVDIGFKEPPRGIWMDAGEHKTDRSLALGDAFALSTAEKLAGDHTEKDVLLLVGADDDYEHFIGNDSTSDKPDILRFRTGSV